MLFLQEGAKGSTIGEADIDLLRKMEPLKGNGIPSLRVRILHLLFTMLTTTHLALSPVLAGQVEWSTWGSKLESIFQPVFDTLPTLAVTMLVIVLCFVCAMLPVLFFVNVFSI